MPPQPIRKLSILIPVFNEIRTLETLLDRVLEAPLPCEREIIIVDDCSTDGSREILARYAREHSCIRLQLHRVNRGKGAAIRTAIRNITGDWAIIQDADLEYDPGEYGKLLVPAEEGLADAVYGSRFIASEYRRAMFFWHSLANKGLTLLSNVFNDLNLTDMETCYKLIRADILKNLVIRSNGFDLEPELTAKLARWGARIYEVPISYRGRTYAEGKKIGAKDAAIALLAMIRYRFLDSQYARHDGFLVLQAVRRAKRFNRWLLAQFEDSIGEEVFEAGCGIGNLTELLLHRKRLVCADLEDFYVDRLRHAYGHLRNFTVGQADLTKLDDLKRLSEGKPFDTIICINVLEHISEDGEVLGNFLHLLKPGGRAVILVPHDPALYTEVDATLGHCLRYTREGLRSRLEEAGFTGVEVKGFNRLGGLGWRISGRLLGRKTLSPGQMKWFEWLMPVVPLLERIPFHRPNSLIAIGTKPD